MVTTESCRNRLESFQKKLHMLQASETRRVELPEVTVAQIMLPRASSAGHGATGLIFVMLRSGLALTALFLYYAPFLPIDV